MDKNYKKDKSLDSLKINTQKNKLKPNDIEDKKKLHDSLLEGPELFVREKFSDSSIDKYNQVVTLTSGKQISPLQLSNFIDQKIADYKAIFPKTLYNEWRRLLGWGTTPDKEHLKPKVFAVYTAELIYGRFYREVLTTLQNINPMNEFGIRNYKHFQLLTPEAKAEVEVFIQQCIEVAKECDTWSEFRKKYGLKYGVPFQYSLFED